MATRIHPTAIVDPGAELASGVEVGAYAVIGADVEIGEDTEIRPHGQVQGPCRIGRENVIHGYAAVGFDPQDLKYAGERTMIEIGDRNSIREFSSLQRGTGFGGGTTRIGSDNLFMAYSHVGHDSQVGSRIVFINGGTLAGHVEVADDATIGAMSSVRQFCRVGRHAYIGGYSVLTQDVLPFAITVGAKPQCMGVNQIGLERKGMSAETIRAIEAALRVLLRSKLNTSQALEVLRAEHAELEETRYLADFVASSERGVIKYSRKGARGAG